MHEDCIKARQHLTLSDSFYEAVVPCLEYPECANFAMVAIMNLCVGNLAAHRKTVDLGIDEMIAKCLADGTFPDEESIGYNCAINYFYLATVDAILGNEKESESTPDSIVSKRLLNNTVATYSVLQRTAQLQEPTYLAHDCLRICLMYLFSEALQQSLCQKQTELLGLINLYKTYIRKLGQILQLSEPGRSEVLAEFKEIDTSYCEDLDEEKAAIRQTIVDELNRSGLPKGCRDDQMLLTDAIFERLVRISITNEFVNETAAQRGSSPILPELISCLGNKEEGWVRDAFIVLACSLLANAAENVDVGRFLVQETEVPTLLLKAMQSASEPTIVHVTAGFARCLAKSVENREILGQKGFIEQCVRYLQIANEQIRLQAAAAFHLLVARCSTNVERVLRRLDSSDTTLFASFLSAITSTEKPSSKVILEVGKTLVAILRVLHTTTSSDVGTQNLLTSLYSHAGLIDPLMVLVRDDSENLRLEGLVGFGLVTRSLQGAKYLSNAVNENGDILQHFEKLLPENKTAQGSSEREADAKVELTAEQSNALATLIGLTNKEVRA